MLAVLTHPKQSYVIKFDIRLSLCIGAFHKLIQLAMATIRPVARNVVWRGFDRGRVWGGGCAPSPEKFWYFLF